MRFGRSWSGCVCGASSGLVRVPFVEGQNPPALGASVPIAVRLQHSGMSLVALEGA